MIRREKVAELGQGKGHETISQQPHVPVTKAVDIIEKVKIHGSAAKEDPTLKERLKRTKTKTSLHFAQVHVDKPQCFWENVPWTDETKWGLLFF